VKLRTRLFVAFFGLAVVPLAGLVFYSYWTSMNAFRQAVEAEAGFLAAGMERRLEATQDRIRRQVERLGELPAFAFSGGESGAAADGSRGADGPEAVDSPAAPTLPQRFLEEIGEDAAYLRGFEFVPAPPGAPGAPGAPGEVREMDETMRLRIKELSRILIEQAATMEAEARRLSEKQDGGTRAPRNMPTPEHLRRMKERAELLGQAFGEGAEAPEPEDGGGTFDSEMAFSVWREGRVLGEVKARVKARELVQSVLRATPRDRGEIPFAVDRGGNLFVTGADQHAVEGVVEIDPETGQVQPVLSDDWIITTRQDQDSGITFGVARPVGDALQEMRGSAVRNLMLGLGLIGVALAGMLPVSRRITRDVQIVAEGAHRVAAGDLNTRVPVRSNDELGALSHSFNLMAEQLSRHQEELMAQERRRKEQEIERRVLAVENQRKTQELDEARRFQLALLPKQLPVIAGLDVAVFTRTATEVGGDYYDFHRDGDQLIVAMGDAVGHGARAGTLVAVIKSLFSSFAHRQGLRQFLADSSVAIRRMGLERSAMALALVRLLPTEAGWRATLTSAGMPPVLLYRAATGVVEEIALPGMPLGGILGFPYQEVERTLEPGDTLLLMSDGFPEALNPDGHELGYGAAQEHFRAAAQDSAQEVVQALTAATEAWTAGAPLDDDVTFVVMRRTEEASP